MQDTGMFLVMEPHSVEWDLGFALASHRYATMRHKTNQCCLSLSFTFLWRLRYEGVEGSKSRFLSFIVFLLYFSFYSSIFIFYILLPFSLFYLVFYHPFFPPFFFTLDVFFF
jgi:hypothetical protein